MLERWTRGVLRCRLLVLAAWTAVAVAGILAGTHLSPLLSNSLAVPGSESDRARLLLEAHYGERPDGTFTIVARAASPGSRKSQEAFRGLLRRAARSVPDGVASDVRRGGGLLYGDVVTPLALEDAKTFTPDVRRALRVPGARQAFVTGAPAIQHDLDPAVGNDLRRAELVALPVALLVLVLVLGVSTAVLIPFVFATATIGGTLALLYPLAHAVQMASYVENLAVLIGLALAIDYALLCVDRFRSELEAGGSRDDVVVRTMATTGRAVVFSAAAVAVGLGVLVLVPVPFVRSLGLGGALVPVVSAAALLTLQPVLLSLLASRVVVRGLYDRRERGVGGTGMWASLAALVLGRRWLSAGAGLVLLLVLAAPVLALRTTPGSILALPRSEAVRGAELLADGVGAGAVTPTQVVVDTGAANGGVVGPARHGVVRLVGAVGRDPEALVVANGVRAPYVAGDGRYTRVVIAGRHEFGHPDARAFVERLRDDLIPAAGFPSGSTVVTGGVPAQGADFLDRLYAWFPFLVGAVLAVSAVVLLRAFRSVVLPLKAVLLSLLSVAAACGVVVAVVQWGVGAGLLGVAEAPAVEGWIPVFAFALLFGLSMDYEVFLVMPMREAIDAGATTDDAVATGLERTGRVVTAAAAIMFAVFSGFVVGGVPGLQQLGIVLAAGVLVDATIVRLALVPGLVAIFGRWSWWLPARLARRGLP
ncbi:MAG TPA: MMPL family transporter [Gaiella sp.]